MVKTTKPQNYCHLCDKNRKGFDGCVWYSSISPETRLCRSCYLKWCKTKEKAALQKKYRNAKPTTKEWSRMCDSLQKAFDKWFYANGGVDL